MKKHALRTIIPLIVLLIIACGYVANLPIGNISAFGWDTVSLLCPLGALSSMLAAKMIAPRALISLAIAVILVLIFGKAFCAYICPTPIISKLRQAIRKEKPDVKTDPKNNPLSDSEKKLLEGCKGGCLSCDSYADVRKGAIDSRHFVLGGALLSALVFGFPVFCLVCPIGLTFATILLMVLLFGGGDVTIAALVCPVILILEVVVFRKWCHKICPLAALMSLVAKGNKTFVPTVDTEKCIDCGKCAQACAQTIDPRHAEKGNAMSECTKCRACVEVCPTGAITMPLLSMKKTKILAEVESKTEKPAEK